MEKKINVGITGQAGFMGTHLSNFLSLQKETVSLISFQDDYFANAQALNTFTGSCDVIVHLAAMNRHGNPQVIYDTNVQLVQQLIASLEQNKAKPLIIFASSTQEERDNPYGASKKEGRRLLEAWAAKNNGKCCGFIIPNVFGPFGNPYYNSVIATFSHQLTHNQTPVIEVDGELKLIYIQELVDHFYQKIVNPPVTSIETFSVPHTSVHKVSEILEKLRFFTSIYFEQHMIPDLHNDFDRNLFNTFRCYIDLETYFPVKYKQNVDDRGSFVEIIRLQHGGQVSFSTTHPGITRGNHFHTRKIERFSVIRGEALIQMRKTGTTKVLDFHISGNDPAFVDMPVWYTHNLINTGDEDMYAIFWINEPYDASDPDTYFEKVIA